LTVKLLDLMLDRVTTITDGAEGIALPALLGDARRTYGTAIRRALLRAGFDDMPRAGARIVGPIARGGVAIRDVVADRGFSKQAASQLIDTLVTRGYVERVPDEADRRRMTVVLTERGQAAAHTIRIAVEGVDAALEREVGAETLSHVRAALATLVALGRDEDQAPAPPRADDRVGR
jgi:DNA-binding MarR family transcriptional regulator